MGVYDDVSTFCHYSPTSTVSTSSSSSSGLASPVYENVEEMTGLCSRSWKMMGKRSSKPSMSDFLAQLPPPPSSFDDEVYGSGFGKRPVESSTSTASSSASSRRPIISSSNHHPPISASPSPPVLLSSPPPPPHPPIPSNCSSIAHSANPHISRCFDMRPLSLPHKEMQRIEREQSNRSVKLLIPNRFDIPEHYAITPACPKRVLIITLLIITIFIVMFALGIYVFYDAIAEHINNIAGSF
ncbi:hypothetical protein L3Y34_015937 [Caenorhabditis briggsae]|uniref:Uncharacterized protein n=1 Tax=Caenorhabditis briggsae TaxID=6238 RepID=A0AAE9DYI5_CAEBR|nr:hypothetical protein L3Y34_015937 [Caenorhabditis briggsae]